MKIRNESINKLSETIGSKIGRKSQDINKTVEAILYKHYHDCEWREIDEKFGKWNTIFQFFNRTKEKDGFASFIRAASDIDEISWLFDERKLFLKFLKAKKPC